MIWSYRVKLCVNLNYLKSNHDHNLFSSLMASVPSWPGTWECANKGSPQLNGCHPLLSSQFLPRSSPLAEVPQMCRNPSTRVGRTSCRQDSRKLKETENLAQADSICQRMAIPSQWWLEMLSPPVFYLLLFSFGTALVCSSVGVALPPHCSPCDWKSHIIFPPLQLRRKFSQAQFSIGPISIASACVRLSTGCQTSVKYSNVFKEMKNR